MITLLQIAVAALIIAGYTFSITCTAASCILSGRRYDERERPRG
jgi:hypothetical protein